eukprot:TRINITY_DN2882_c0_g1_i1.p1 TRINITY_DN2882_c0_g1~~TRINITY_DN2882_c0_g1_i1.p1  ORF type:complete len:497 (+),score=66.75 TRINITY_DN2882_c0_g1_i1:50-1540(+)
MKLFFCAILFALFGKVVGEPCPVAEIIDDGDTVWCLMSSAMVLLMTPGLAFFYGGLVRKKNVINTLMMSYVAMGVICVHWALVGYSFSYGPGNEGFGSFKWGGLRYVGTEPNPDYAPTIPHIAFANYQMMFAVVTPALISGGIVERMKFRSYVLYILIWTTVVYDPLAHWMWSAQSHHHDDGTCEYKKGWLRQMGAVDFAGGTVVHIASGFSALTASYIVGKRTGYDAKQGVQASSVPFVLLGAGLLWFGWIGFNGGSALSRGTIASIAVINTSLSAASAFMTWMVLDMITARKPSAVGAATGAVIGMISITPGSGSVYPGFALLFGMIACCICYSAIRFKRFFRVDDSLDVFFCHGVGGIVGTLLTGLFSTKEVNSAGEDGAFYGNPKLFGLQLLAVVVSVGLSTIATAVILLVFKYTPIGLRTNEKWEEDGLDAAEHGDKKDETNEAELAVMRLQSAFKRTANPITNTDSNTSHEEVEIKTTRSKSEEETDLPE